VSAVSDEPSIDEQLLHRIDNQVLWLTINRPDAGNAIPGGGQLVL
jgi:hypothetical protein